MLVRRRCWSRRPSVLRPRHVVHRRLRVAGRRPADGRRCADARRTAARSRAGGAGRRRRADRPGWPMARPARRRDARHRRRCCWPACWRSCRSCSAELDPGLTRDSRSCPALRLAFEVEPLGMLFALIASGLWIVNSLYSIGYMRANAEAHQTRFFVCFALALAATMGIAFAANVFTLFVFYELLTLVTYPLVTHHGTEEARRAGAPTSACCWAPPSCSCCRRWCSRGSSAGTTRLHARRHPRRQARRRAASACCSRSTCSASARPR